MYRGFRPAHFAGNLLHPRLFTFNCTFRTGTQNFNPGLLPQDHPLRREIFENMASTSGLFLALEPQVFVSKIRCRVFRNWKAAEDYYSNTLREAKFSLAGEKQPEPEIEDAEDLRPEVKVPPAIIPSLPPLKKSN